VILQDMVDRINANRKHSMDYVTGGEGTDKGYQNCGGMNGAARDLCEWSNALVGASESSGGLKVGAMIGARGCVTAVNPVMPRQFLVSVVWQGLNPTIAPTATACGAGRYGNETQRRAITTSITIGCLYNNPATGACMTP